MTAPNLLFPGRPDYIGPHAGVFGFVHHEILCEHSHNIMERLKYIDRNKPAHEIAIRRHNMIYLGGCEAAAKRAPLDADYRAKHAPLYADYVAKRDALSADYAAKRAPLSADYVAKRAPLDADYRAKRDALSADYVAKHAPLYADYVAKRDALDAEILAYIRRHIPDCAWNGKTLVFPRGPA